MEEDVKDSTKKKLTLGLIAALALASTDCFWPTRRGRGYVYRPSFGARVMGHLIAGAIVGTALAVASADAARYNAASCSTRMFYNGRWHFYCQDRWAYYEGGAWFAYPPAPPPPPTQAPPAPPADAPPPPTLPAPGAPPPVP